MAKYMIHFNYSQASREGLVAKPQDRGAALAKVFEKAGGAVDAFYFCFGTWDGVVIADFPSHIDTAAALMAVGSTGAFDRVETAVLIETDEAVRSMEIAGQITQSYVAPNAA